MSALAREVAPHVASRRPIRVLHLRDSPWVDGPGRTILETASHVNPSRLEYHVGAFVAEGKKHPLVEALEGRSAFVHRLPDRPGVDREAIEGIVALIDKLGIDVLHTSEFRSNVFGLLVRRRRPVKLVSTVHGWIANDFRGKVYRTIDKALLRWFDGVIVVSKATRSLVPRWWLPEKRVCVLYNALVLDAYGKDVLTRPAASRPAGQSVTLLNVGRLSPEKGQDLLLASFARVAKDFPGLRLVFAGIGPLEASLREQAASLGVADRVEFLGFVADMPRVYERTDLVVQSSLTEGMPNVILEAAYLRVPILATRVGGTEEIVRHGHSACLIPPGSGQALEDGIRRFLADRAEFGRMAQAAHERILAEFSFTYRTERLTAFYEALCGTPS